MSKQIIVTTVDPIIPMNDCTNDQNLAKFYYDLMSWFLLILCITFSLLLWYLEEKFEY